MTPENIIDLLELEAHPEGGAFRETWRQKPQDGSRGTGSSIYYLLREGERSRRHRIDATEIWHYYAGGALQLLIESEEGHPGETLVLGPDLEAGQRPQLLVPPHAWQSAHSLGAWTLVGCTVSPAFEFEHFEMDADDREPR